MSSITTNNSGSTALSLPTTPAAHWLLRASVAATFIYHGIDKFPSLAAGAEFMGLPLALWTLVAVLEVVGGVALLAGGLMSSKLGDVLTRLGGLSVIVIMIGAVYLVHWGQWSALPSETHPAGGMEFQVLLLATGLFFSLRGNAA
ncbi:DoxX family protein [Maritalea mobilis]|uniref:DoxX family protein n=1 Tax=Maritalea mobilis TaxID=483324 RepID=UPI001C96BBF1|nr:DoxX family protein [Maritalea mobilis]MBY6202153.1 DoxX family protein [Maritalea mobilis]